MRKEELYAKIKAEGFKLTPQRQGVIDVLLDHEDATLSAEQIYLYTRIANPSIGLATVYRFLEILTENQVLVKVIHADGVAHYRLHDSQMAGGPIYFVCSLCGNTQEFPAALLQPIMMQMSQVADVKIQNYVVVFHGFCRHCQEIKEGLNHAF